MPAPKLLSDQIVSMWRTVVGQQIRDKRVSVKMTQADVAGWLGWSRTTLVAIEAGGQSVSLDQLFRLSALFDCHVADLLPGELAGYGRQRY